MDVVLVSNDRPRRLAATLGSLLAQEINEERRLFLIDNGAAAHSSPSFVSILRAFQRIGWSVNVLTTHLDTISRVKHFAYSQATDEIVIALDNDVLFTRADTLSAMAETLRGYNVAAVSPLAYDIDDQRPILANDQHYYSEVTPDSNGVAEGLTALGLCLGFRRSDFMAVRKFWCQDFPYMEDQILVHFLKQRRGYAHLHNHVVYHVSIAETPSYVFDHDEVIAYLTRRAQKQPEYQPLLELRMSGEDAAAFRREVVCNVNR